MSNRIIKEISFRIVEGVRGTMLEWPDGCGDIFLGTPVSEIENFNWQAYISDQIRQQMLVLYNKGKDKKTRKGSRDRYLGDVKVSLTEMLSVRPGRPDDTDQERQAALDNLLRRGVEAARKLKKDLTRARLGIEMGIGDIGLRDELKKHGLNKAQFVELIKG